MSDEPVLKLPRELPDVAKLAGDRVPAIQVVDVGAMLLETPPYKPLLDLPRSTLLGFEPGEEERLKLEKHYGVDKTPDGRQRYTFLPHVVGDGRDGVFRSCEWNATSSLYEPNVPLLSRFMGMREAHVAKERIPVKTRSLDELPEALGMTMLKMDVQGAELDVIRGATKALSTAVFVHLEVQFVPLYEGVPYFSDVDVAMRQRGFIMHSMTRPGTGTFAPLGRKPGSGNGQWLWADAMYFRDFMKLDQLSSDQLMALAIIAERCYQQHDLALAALRAYDDKEGTGFYESYCVSIVGQVRPKPELIST